MLIRLAVVTAMWVAQGAFANERSDASSIEVPDASLETWNPKWQKWDAGWKLSKTGRTWADGAHRGKFCALIHSTADTERCCLLSPGLPPIKSGMELRIVFFARWLKGDNRVWVTFEDLCSYPMDWYPLGQCVIPKDGQWHRLQVDINVPPIPEDVTLRVAIGLPQPTQKSPWTKPITAPPDTEYLLDDVSVEILKHGRTPASRRPVTPSCVLADVRDNSSLHGVFWTPWRTYCGVPISTPHDYDKTHDEIRKELDLMQRIGIKWVRSIWRWDKIEWDKGQFHYELLDFVVAEAWKRDIRIVPALATPPRWTSTAPPDEPAFRIYPPDLADWETFVHHVVNHFKERIKYWEVWNEPNIFGRWHGTVEDYFRLHRAAFAAARRADPSSKVLLGAFANSGHAYLDRLMRLGVKDYFDILSCHPYPGKGGPDKIEHMVNRLRLVLADHGCEDRPIWFTEVGWKDEDAGSPTERNRWVSDLYARAFGGAVEKRFWFVFDTWSRQPVQGGFALVNYREGKWELTPAYYAYGQLTSQVVGPKRL